ncbi:hypothetical protein PMI10_00642 [Flavobacterium sp. CF136]|nr:hypothetical protein PMI10_00642 [Flavobacterium sp. CF136]
MKKITLLLTILILVSCTGKRRDFCIRLKSNENSSYSWIYCDSVKMKSKNEAIFYINGKGNNLFGYEISIQSN